MSPTKVAVGPNAFSPEWIAGSELTCILWDKADRDRADITWVTKFVRDQDLDNIGSAARRLDAVVVKDLRLNASLQRVPYPPSGPQPHREQRPERAAREHRLELQLRRGRSAPRARGLFPLAPIHVKGGVTVRW